MAKIQIRIYPNGEIKAETHGAKGKKCLQYLSVIEKLTNSVIEDSEFTQEYLEREEMLDQGEEESVMA
ncbi:MAG: DUF2997 domain-containing protein [Oscillospiraceae bacterium]|nr:DUF2997 domain-containing protein [Oscillospiraceae bacterium]